MAKVSVLVPVYNVGKYLGECLQSLCGQSMKDIEMVCVDDGSTDDSGRILDDYAGMDSRIKVIHKENTGYGNSMNVALEHAGGDFIAILESDDFAEPYMLERLYKAAVENQADIVKGEYYRHSFKGDEYSGRLKDFPLGTAFLPKDRPDVIEFADTIWTCLYRRQFLDECGIRFHETPGASFQDISFAIQGWLNARKICFIPDALVHYRIDNMDSSMHNPDKVFCVFDEYEWLEWLFAGKWGRFKELEKYFVAMKYRDYLNHYYRVSSRYQYALLVRLAQSLKLDREKNRLCETAFKPNIFEQLARIQNDMNGFFKSTAKKHDDFSLNGCKFENDDLYRRGFIECIREYPQVVVYGAGKVGRWLAMKLYEKNVGVYCFAVTRKNDEGDECMGIPVRELSELGGIAEDCAVIIAIAENRQYELYWNTQRYRFKHVFRVDDIIRGIL